MRIIKLTGVWYEGPFKLRSGALNVALCDDGKVRDLEDDVVLQLDAGGHLRGWSDCISLLLDGGEETKLLMRRRSIAVPKKAFEQRALPA